MAAVIAGMIPLSLAVTRQPGNYLLVGVCSTLYFAAVAYIVMVLQRRFVAGKDSISVQPPANNSLKADVPDGPRL